MFRVVALFFVLLLVAPASAARIEGQNITKQGHVVNGNLTTRAPGTVVNNGCDCGSTDVNTPCGGRSISVTVPALSSIGTQENATFSWEFNSGGGPAVCGKFANGDYWLAPVVGQSTVTITAIASNNTVGLDADPKAESQGLLNAYGSYSADEDISDELPKSYSGINSLVASKKRNEAVVTACRASPSGCIDAYHVVTVLPSVPALNGSRHLRPNITGETKTLLTLDDFDFSTLPSKTYFDGGTTTDLEKVRARWAHASEVIGWSGEAGEYSTAEAGRAFRSQAMTDDYGAGRSKHFYDDLMRLFSDEFTLEQKEPALASMLSYGLDNYHFVYDSPEGVTRRWHSGAGQHPGRFPPAVVAVALMKNNAAYAANVASEAGKVSSLAVAGDQDGPQEIEQINAGVNGPVWGDNGPVDPSQRIRSYWGNLFGPHCWDDSPEPCIPIGDLVTNRSQGDPYGYIDGPAETPGEAYIAIAYTQQRAFLATAALLPSMCGLINYPALKEFVVRASTEGIKVTGDGCAPPDPREPPDCIPYGDHPIPPWTNCAYAGVTWGPSNLSDLTSACIPNNSGGNTGQTGRYSQMAPKPLSTESSYRVTAIEDNWSEIEASGACEGVW